MIRQSLNSASLMQHPRMPVKVCSPVTFGLHDSIVCPTMSSVTYQMSWVTLYYHARLKAQSCTPSQACLGIDTKMMLCCIGTTSARKYDQLQSACADAFVKSGDIPVVHGCTDIKTTSYKQLLLCNYNHHSAVSSTGGAHPIVSKRPTPHTSSKALFMIIALDCASGTVAVP